MSEFKMTRAMWESEFNRVRKGQLKQAERELLLLKANPDSVICPTCNGTPSSMGGRGYGMRMQAFCFTCTTGVIDFDTWKQLGEERRAARKASLITTPTQPADDADTSGAEGA